MQPKNNQSKVQAVTIPIKVAVLIDGGFFIKRYNALYNQQRRKSAATVANDICKLAFKHAGNENLLYRIFYYDCPPIEKRVHNPITNRCVNFATSELAVFKKELLKELKAKRKVALRLGDLKTSDWQFKPQVAKDIMRGQKDVANLEEDDIIYGMQQKGIDMKIGIDIVTIALKKLADKIVLVSGDSDFVPAAKMARREGIDFILDAMYAPHIDSNLNEHIDGLKSFPLYRKTVHKNEDGNK